jgi:hypothetical protein
MRVALVVNLDGRYGPGPMISGWRGQGGAKGGAIVPSNTKYGLKPTAIHARTTRITMSRNSPSSPPYTHGKRDWLWTSYIKLQKRYR